MFVKQSLVLLVPRAEVLQELMSQFHDLLHSDILALVKKAQRKNSCYIRYFDLKCENLHSGLRCI